MALGTMCVAVSCIIQGSPHTLLTTHPASFVQVSFGAPDEKYGEVVAAAVVLRPGADKADPGALAEAIRQHCAVKLSGFKVGARARQSGD